MDSANRRRRASLLGRSLAVVAVGGLLLAACSSASDSSSSSGSAGTANQAAPKDEGAPVNGGDLKVGVSAQIDGLEPASNRWSLDGNLIASSIFDPLLTFDENRNLVPKLATSVTPNADGTVWTIRLRENVTFHDGSPLTAEVVKNNIDKRKSNPLSGGALAPVQEVVAVDPTTVEVRMSTPWFGYDYTLAAQGGYIEGQAQLDAGPDATRTAIGTGPFKQVSGPYSPGQDVQVARFDGYWGDKAHLDSITFKGIVDDKARAQALKAGDVDLIFTQNPDTIAEFRKGNGFVQVEDPAAEESFAMLNLGQPPFDNIHARRALAYATDRAQLVENQGLGVTQEADGPYTKGEKYYNEQSGYPAYDLAKAQEEVEKYKQDTGQPSLSFTLDTSEGEQILAQALQQQWAAAGIDAKINLTEQTAFLTQMFLGKFQAAMFRNFAYVNPDSNYIFWHSSQAKGIGTGSINFGQIKDPALDRALDTARATSDEAARLQEYKQLTPTLNEVLPYVWVWHNDWALATKDRVGGLSVPQKLGFARQDAKPWWDRLWLKPSSGGGS
ncbi:MAG: ABC transporter substrate-binding protein [Acidimicrobiales bacterium]